MSEKPMTETEREFVYRNAARVLAAVIAAGRASDDAKAAVGLTRALWAEMVRNGQADDE